jgi:hypothetical protein
MPLLFGAITASNQQARADTGSMFAIKSIYLSTATSTISFTGIPSTYKHLQLRMLLSTDRATYAIDNARITYNGDSSSGLYSWHSLEANVNNSGTPTSGADWSINYGQMGTVPSSAAPLTFASYIVDIYDYANTNKGKTGKSYGGFELTSNVAGYGGTNQLTSFGWRNTAAINRIDIDRQTGSNFLAGSRIDLYGIKG